VRDDAVEIGLYGARTWMKGDLLTAEDDERSIGGGNETIALGDGVGM
jgi:hypothetical protein